MRHRGMIEEDTPRPDGLSGGTLKGHRARCREGIKTEELPSLRSLEPGECAPEGGGWGVREGCRQLPRASQGASQECKYACLKRVNNLLFPHDVCGVSSPEEERKAPGIGLSNGWCFRVGRKAVKQLRGTSLYLYCATYGIFYLVPSAPYVRLSSVRCAGYARVESCGQIRI